MSTISGADYDLGLSFERHGERLIGEYVVGAARGSFNGSVTGQAVAAELKPSDACTYSFTGVLTDSSLVGSFEPSDCHGGQPGAWSLERK